MLLDEAAPQGVTLTKMLVGESTDTKTPTLYRLRANKTLTSLTFSAHSLAPAGSWTS